MRHITWQAESDEGPVTIDLFFESHLDQRREHDLDVQQWDRYWISDFRLERVEDHVALTAIVEQIAFQES